MLPNLPLIKIKTAAVCGTYRYIDRIEQLGIRVIPVPENPHLSKPVCAHADMNLCFTGTAVFIAKEQTDLIANLKAQGFVCIPVKQDLKPEYPFDAALNCAVLDDYAVLNPKTADPQLSCALQNKKWITVRQGYTKCACLFVASQAVITADKGVCTALQKSGMDVLLIRPGFIKLPGYDYGFIGGCGGLIDRHTMLFTGNIEGHPDFPAIRSFLEKYRVSYLALPGELEDIGGILPLE